jgi:hypothetical protein
MSNTREGFNLILDQTDQALLPSIPQEFCTIGGASEVVFSAWLISLELCSLQWRAGATLRRPGETQTGQPRASGGHALRGQGASARLRVSPGFYF